MEENILMTQPLFASFRYDLIFRHSILYYSLLFTFFLVDTCFAFSGEAQVRLMPLFDYSNTRLKTRSVFSVYNPNVPYPFPASCHYNNKILCKMIPCYFGGSCLNYFDYIESSSLLSAAHHHCILLARLNSYHLPHDLS